MIEFPQLMQVLTALISLGALITTIVMARGKAASDRVTALEKANAEKASVGRVGATEDRVDRIENRLTILEGDVKYLPRQDHLHAMELMLRDMQGELREMRESFRPVALSVDRINEFFLSQVAPRRGP